MPARRNAPSARRGDANLFVLYKLTGYSRAASHGAARKTFFNTRIVSDLLMNLRCHSRGTTTPISGGKTGRLVIVDEAYAACGVSAEIAAIVASEGLYDLDAPIHRICEPAPHAFSPSLDN